MAEGSMGVAMAAMVSVMGVTSEGICPACPRLGRGYAAFFVQCSTKRGGFQWKKPRPHGGDGALQGQLRRASGT